MTKEEVVELLILIESVYSNCICKDETVQQWFQLCSAMDYEKVMAKLKSHIRKYPYPPSIDKIAVFSFEKNGLPAALQGRMEEKQERMNCERNNNKRIPVSDWLVEYSTRKSI
ncbi:hypothetical protein [Neobacillus drentensis]|uniref:hypothetical protein n=1 Tax=Neobacillus drentensis TaxID=220684 RepID=UPI002FFF2C03